MAWPYQYIPRERRTPRVVCDGCYTLVDCAYSCDAMRADDGTVQLCAECHAAWHDTEAWMSGDRWACTGLVRVATA